MDTSDKVMAGLKDRVKLIKGAAPVANSWNYATLISGPGRSGLSGYVAEDPACYLTDEEIGIKS